MMFFMAEHVSHACTLIKSKLVQLSRIASSPLIRFFNNTPGNEILILINKSYAWVFIHAREYKGEPHHNTDKFLKTNSFTSSLLCTKILSNSYKIRLQSSPLTNWMHLQTVKWFHHPQHNRNLTWNFICPIATATPKVPPTEWGKCLLYILVLYFI